MEDTQPESGYFFGKPSNGQDNAEILDCDSTLDRAIVENALIPHEIISKQWVVPCVNDSPNSGLKLSEKLLKVIGDLTNCRVELRTDRKSISIRGENDLDVDRACSKLEVAQDWAVGRPCS